MAVPAAGPGVHGYGDTFTDAELERNADLDGVRSGWVALVQDTGADYAVLGPDSALAYNLREVEHWTVLEHSDDLELLQPTSGMDGRIARGSA